MPTVTEASKDLPTRDNFIRTEIPAFYLRIGIDITGERVIMTDWGQLLNRFPAASADETKRRVHDLFEQALLHVTPSPMEIPAEEILVREYLFHRGASVDPVDRALLLDLSKYVVTHPRK